EICEQLIECTTKARLKVNECIASHDSPLKAVSKCHNETLHKQLKRLIEERDNYYEGCLRKKMPEAAAIDNAKKRAKCQKIVQKNPFKQNIQKSRRSMQRDRNINQQKQCYKDVKKMRIHCSLLAKCCSISKQ
ncbi:unnamed protein product, partial [Dracunculus medinensis]|uniref:CX9C domain-containing protein n=1 Tax=Dracunculus medinensis TaxID=318479 RepID=A0A0N4U4D7_DRAME